MALCCVIGDPPLAKALTIVDQPGFKQVQTGEDVELSVSATGRNLQYQWYKNGIEMTGRTAAVLRLVDVKETDSATYMVRITEGRANSLWSAPGIITVLPGRGGTINICNWNINPGNRSVPVVHPDSGEKLTGTDWLAQPFVGQHEMDLRPVGPAVPFYGSELPGMWYKQPNSLRTIGHIEPGAAAMVQFRVWQTGTGVTFEEALENGSNYFASNIFSYTTGGAGSPPSIPPGPQGLEKFFYNSGLPVSEATITLEPSSTEVPLGESASLTAAAEGPGLRMQWFMNGLPLPGATGPSVEWENVSLEDQGTYWLAATDENGNTATSSPVVLVVSDRVSGTYNMCNWNLGTSAREVPVIHPDTDEALAGTAWLAQVFIGETEYDLQPAGPAMTFYQDPLKGFVRKDPSPARRAHGFAPGQKVMIQYRVWQAGTGAGFEEALGNGSDFFASNIFQLTLGGAGSPPSFPTSFNGLESFSFNDGLPVDKARILGGPDSRAFLSGQPASLEVQAEGRNLSFQWFRNGAAVTDSNTAVLDLGTADSGIEGTWSVVVSDDLGNSILSKPAVVLVNGARNGTIDICNWNLDGDMRSVPVVHPEDGPLTGTGWMAQVYAGNSAWKLAPVGPAMTFYGEEFPGFWLKEPSSARQVPGVLPGQDVTIQIRVWESAGGPDFESALTNGADFFASNVFQVTTGGVGSPPSFPAKINGLTEFHFNDGLPPEQAEIVGQTASKEVLMGSNLEIGVEAIGNDLSYSWTRNGVPMDGVDGPAIEFTEIRLEDQATYQVTVTDGSGHSVTGEPIVVLVNAATGGAINICNFGLEPGNRGVPVIHPEGDTPLTGTGWLAQAYAGSHAYDLAPVGPAVPFYGEEFAGYWFKEPSPTRRIPDIPAGREATVQIRIWESGTGSTFEEALESGSNFFASNIFTVVTGGAGSPPSLPATIDGLTGFEFNGGLPPEVATILTQPSHTRVKEGENFELSVEATGPGITYQWLFNTWTIPGANGPALSFDDASAVDEGTYEVVVTDENGETVLSEPAIVIVVPPAGGSIDICNWNLGSERRAVPVVHPETGIPLEGRDWIAQPFAGSSAFDMVPVGPALPFYTDDLAGLYRKELTPTRIIPHIPAGQPATIQIRVWESSVAPDFEDALEQGSNFFASNIFEVRTGGAGSPPSFPATIDGLQEFFYNSGLPQSRILWKDPAAIEYGTALSGVQLNAETDAPGSFDYSPAAGTVLPAGTHRLSAVFTPDNPAISPVEVAVTIQVLKATPSFTGRPVMNWPTDSPVEPLMFAGMEFSHPGTIAAFMPNGSPLEYGISMIRPGQNRITVRFTPADADNVNPLEMHFFIEGLLPKKEDVKPTNTKVTGSGITIELPVERNTFYQIEFSEDLIKWVVVFVSDDETSPDFQAALAETQEKGFYRIRSFTRVLQAN